MTDMEQDKNKGEPQGHGRNLPPDPVSGPRKARFCWNCGGRLDERFKFCPECGAKRADAGDNGGAPYMAAPPAPPVSDTAKQKMKELDAMIEDMRRRRASRKPGISSIPTPDLKWLLAGSAVFFVILYFVFRWFSAFLANMMNTMQ